MIEEGCLENVDEIYGLHNDPYVDAGMIKTKAGPITAARTRVEIKVNGKGGHGSLPHKVIDPISAACFIYNNLHTIKSRNIDN